jgi:uncharacterized RDD family membrane protein YckC
MNTSQFRYLLTAYFLLSLAGIIFDFVFPSTIPNEYLQAKAILNKNESNQETTIAYGVLIIALVICLIGNIVAFIGLFWFHTWARRISVITTVILILASPAVGASLSSGWASAFSELAATLWGVILAIAYLTPIKENFTPTSSQYPMSPQEMEFQKMLAFPGKRWQGQFIDALIALFLFFVPFYILNYLIPREQAFYSSAILGLGYFLFADALPNGQSIAKKLLNIQVVSKETMRPCTLSQSFLRNITAPLGIFDWASIFFDSRRRLGDYIASTIVVKKAE